MWRRPGRRVFAELPFQGYSGLPSGVCVPSIVIRTPAPDVVDRYMVDKENAAPTRVSPRQPGGRACAHTVGLRSSGNERGAQWLGEGLLERLYARGGASLKALEEEICDAIDPVAGEERRKPRELIGDRQPEHGDPQPQYR
jgi:hypothetical protein